MSSNNESNSVPLPSLKAPDLSSVKLSDLSNKKQPDYIVTHSRGRDIWSLLLFNTGHCWLGGFVLGGAYGSLRGWREAANPSFRVRFNSVLNNVSIVGGRTGSVLGVLAFIHTGFLGISDLSQYNSYTARILDGEISKHAFAGLATGMFYKSTSGIRGAGLAGLIGASLSVSFLYATSWYESLDKKKRSYKF